MIFLPIKKTITNLDNNTTYIEASLAPTPPSYIKHLTQLLFFLHYTSHHHKMAIHSIFFFLKKRCLAPNMETILARSLAWKLSLLFRKRLALRCSIFSSSFYLSIRRRFDMYLVWNKLNMIESRQEAIDLILISIFMEEQNCFMKKKKRIAHI